MTNTPMPTVEIPPPTAEMTGESDDIFAGLEEVIRKDREADAAPKKSEPEKKPAEAQKETPKPDEPKLKLGTQEQKPA